MRIKVICINLKTSTERRKHATNLIKKIFDDFYIFDAIEGKEINITDTNNPNIKNIEYRGNIFLHDTSELRKMSYGELGCALSHYVLYNHLINDTDYDAYLIFEDDIKFNDNIELFHEYFNKLDTLSNLDICLLQQYEYWRSNRIYSSNSHYDKLTYVKHNYTMSFMYTFSYIITKSGANKILARKKSYINLPSDTLLDKLYTNNILEVYIPKRQFFIQNGFKSDIWSFNSNEYNSNTITWDKANTPISNPINNFVDIYSASRINKYDNIKKYRIKVLCDWCSSYKLCDAWNKQSKGSYTWNNITITSEDNDIDYYVIFNYPQKNNYYVPDRTIIIHMEPEHNSKNWNEWANPDPTKFLKVRTQKICRNVANWDFLKTYNDLMNEKIVKTKVFSTITSSIYISDHYRKRVDFIKYLESKNVKIDIYGRSNTVGFINYLGQLSSDNKIDGLYPYKYTFAAENCIQHNYFTEKLIDAILSECLCFYYGCPNIGDYIDERAYIKLDLNDFEKSYNIVNETINNNEYEKRIDIIKKEKLKILNELQFFPTLENIILEHEKTKIKVV